jgi:hypothetical protein
LMRLLLGMILPPDLIGVYWTLEFYMTLNNS